MKIRILSTPDSEYTFKKGGSVKFKTGGSSSPDPTPLTKEERIEYDKWRTEYKRVFGDFPEEERPDYDMERIWKEKIKPDPNFFYFGQDDIKGYERSGQPKTGVNQIELDKQVEERAKGKPDYELNPNFGLPKDVDQNDRINVKPIVSNINGITDDEWITEGKWGKYPEKVSNRDPSQWMEPFWKGRIDIDPNLSMDLSANNERDYSKGTPVSSVKYNVDPAKYKRAKDLYAKAKASKNPEDMKIFQKTFHQDFPELSKSIVGAAPTTTYGVANKLPNTNTASNEDGQDGPRTRQYIAELDKLYNNGKSEFTPITPVPPQNNIEKLSGTNQPEYKDSPLNPDEYKPTVKPTFGGDKFDYSQIVPEGLALINDPGIKTWTRKSYINEVKPTTLNVQAELNENQADSYYAIGKNVGNPAVNKSVISQIVANKYAANNKIYEAKNNFDMQSLNQANNINNQNIERLDEVNYGRAKKQFDERDMALENQYARKNEIFNSLSGKLASYKHDQSTKKLWFDLLSKNYDYSKGEFTINPETGQPWINPDIVIKSKESTKKTK